MKVLTFVRHAQSVSNAGGITMPHATIPLSDLGHAQAHQLANVIDVTPVAVLVSGFTRTHQTAAPFCAKHSTSYKILTCLNEFSVIDPLLIQGLNGIQRKPFVKEYWDNPDPHRRLGAEADTFAEFVDRVNEFVAQMDNLTDSTLIFGHGIWFAMLQWLLNGNSATESATMCAFRRFQISSPIQNCAVFKLINGGTGWIVSNGHLDCLSA